MASGRNMSGSKGAAAPTKQENFRPPVYDYVDMPQEHLEFIIETCENVLRMLNKGEKKFYYECAEAIKRAMDEQFGPSYHVIVGRDFGSFFDYEAGYCVQLWINQHCFLIFKHG